MTTTPTMPTTTETSFDVCMLPGGKDRLPEVPLAARQLITERAVALLAAHPTVQRSDVAELVYRLWDDLRARRYGPSTSTIEAVLSTGAVGGPITELREVLFLLVATGTVLATLRKERAALDATIQSLERHATRAR